MSAVAESPDHATTRLVAFDARRPWIFDSGIVAALIAMVMVNRGLGASSVAFGCALALPLLWRRRYPLIVFGILASIALAQWLLDVRTLGDAALLVALYSVAVYEPTRTMLIAACILEIGVILATVRWAIVQPGKVWIGLTGLATAAGLLGMSVRSRRALVNSLHERAAQLEYERDQQGLLAAAAERARIAREMHDIVAHHLTVMIALADGASYQLSEAPERAEAAMSTASRTGRQALTEMRRLLGVLREETQPALHPQPGLAQIDLLVERLRAAGVQVRYEVSGSPAGIEPGLQLTAHRIVQEALTNTLKHAGESASVCVTVSCTREEVSIEVRDNGTSIIDAEIHEGGGLRGMRERASVYGGIVQAGPHPDGGWSVRARLALGVSEPALQA